MLNLSTLYMGQDDFAKFVNLSRLNLQKECLVRIYASEKGLNEAHSAAKAIKEIIPMSHIVGSSASGITLKGKRYEEATLVIIEQFVDARVDSCVFDIGSKSFNELAEEFKEKFLNFGNAALHLLAGDNYADIYQYVEKINELCPKIRLTGGISGDLLGSGIKGFVFDHTGAYPNGIIAGGISGNATVTSLASLSCDPISPVYTVTKCHGSKVIEIDHRPATQWCREQLGMEDMQEYKHNWQVIAENDALVRFPLILEGHSGAARFIKYDAGDMSLYFSKINEGTTFRIGYTSPTKSVQESLEHCQDLSRVPVESIFSYSCLFRKHYLENCADWELKPFADYGICGAFIMGEICHLNGRNEFLNGACAIIACADKDSYITPDFNVFEDLYKIKDDSNKLRSLVIAKQSTAMSNENRLILNELLEKQKYDSEQLYIDPITELPNTIKFAQENISRSYDKICLVQVENSALILNHFGRDYYRSLLKTAISQLLVYLKGQEIADKLYTYAMNDSVLFIAATSEISDDAFTQFSEKLYSNFRLINLGGKNELFVNRFAVILGGANVLEKGLAILQESRGQQSYFSVSQITGDSHDYLENEIEMLHVICTAIDHNLIVPYIQGIYNNNTKEITKYEALMRIKDENGNIYAPGHFMSVAKKYHLYSAISYMMIELVMDAFNGRSEQVAINLSAYDVNYEPMRSFILKKLDKMQNCENFVFEFLEDEEFTDFKTLRSFIEALRSHGAKIAIDDFGSGYSSFLEIVRMEPDYIKVDGSIVKNIAKDDISHKVLSTIAGLASHLHSQIIAEFVENEEIQNHLLEMGVPFSQGYFFSVPSPMEF